MTKSRAAFSILLIAWFWLLYVGHGVYCAVIAQHMSGDSHSSQFNMCMAFPGLWMAVNIVLIVFARKVPFLAQMTGVIIQMPAAFMFFMFADVFV